MKFYACLMYVFLGFLLAACDMTSYEPIEGKIELSVFSVMTDNTYRNPNNPDAYTSFFGLRSEKIYACSNPIAATITADAENIDIAIKGVVQEEGCFPLPGPATIRLPIKLSNGTYRLSVGYQGKEDTYSVSVENLKFDIIPLDTGFTYLE